MNEPADPSYTPQNIISGVKGLVVAFGVLLGSVLTFSSRRDANRNQSKSIDLAERRESLEERVSARQAAEVEIARKESEISWWKKYSIDGWNGLNNAVLGWTRDNHISDNNETILIGAIERDNRAADGNEAILMETITRAGVVPPKLVPRGGLPKIRERFPVPDVQVLAGRKKGGEP